jgi:aminoglycoside 6'-N-acetyltransferase I
LSSRYGLQLRAASPADAPGLHQLLLAAGHEFEMSALASRLEAFQHVPGTTLLAHEWGPPSGIITLHWYPTIEADHPIAQLTTLLVAPDARRRGIGRLLLKAASQAARVAGCDSLECFSNRTQPELQAFLLATGFAGLHNRFVRSLRKKV